jgi:hypothetical protein
VVRHATTWECDRCPATVTKRRRAGRPNLCKACAATAMADAANQMAEKRGPAYERWLASMAKAVAGATGGQR